MTRAGRCLSPVHGEAIAVGPPAHLDAADLHRQRAVLASIGRKLVKCQTNCLGRGCIQTQFRAMHREPGAHKIGKVGELGARQVFDINSLPLVADQQVLIGRNMRSVKAHDKVLRLTSCGLAGNCLHET